MIEMRIPALTIAMFCALGVPALATAQDTLPGSHADERGPPSPHRPPPEAFSACQGKTEGAACQVTFRERTLAGSCVAPQGDELFCRPNEMPPPPGGEGPGGAPPAR